MSRFPLTLSVLALTVGLAPGQPRTDTIKITGDSPATLKRLVELQSRLESGQPVLSDLLTILDDAGDDLVRGDRPDLLRPARHAAQSLIGRLSAAELAQYRARVEVPSRKLFDQGLASRSRRPLIDLLERYPNSRIAPQAISILGELQLEAGLPATAEATWQLWPDTNNPDEKKTRLELAVTAQKTIPPPASLLGTWTTLGGDPGRSGRTDARLPIHWPSQPTWRVPISTVDGVKRPDELANSVAPHPVVLGTTVYVADATTIYAIPVSGGPPSAVFSSSRPAGTGPKPKSQTVDFALTVANGSIYGRFGSPILWPNPTAEEPFNPTSELVRLIPQRDGSLKAVWTRQASPGSTWLGAPVVVDGRIVAANVRKSGNRLVYSLQAFDEGAPLWERSILETDLPSGEPKSRHDLVSVSDDVVVFNTNAGAAVAVDVTTGRPLWTWKYPRLEPTGKALAMAWTANHRDISPPIIHDGVAVIAPTDAARIAGIELRSGRLLWEHVGYHVETVMGVANRKVVAVMAGPMRSVRAFDLRTGGEEYPEGWANTDDPGLASLGRGLVSDELILWPTRTGLYALNPKTGRPAMRPILGSHGNLAYANQTLIVVNPNEVLGYSVPEPYRRATR